MIRLEQASKSYDDGATWAVRQVDLHVDRGNLLVLVGESGCGKTTTLKMMNRLVERSEGRVTLGGEDVHAIAPITLRRRIGYVFQGVGLFPHMTVARNVAIVPRLLGWSRSKIEQRTEELLQLVGLEPATFAARYPAALSGGQQQRVGVARALAARPDVLLMDEPFGALDPVTRDEMREQLRGLQQQLGVTVVLVTHDMTEALLLGDRIVVMQDGRIVGDGTPSHLMTESDHPYVRQMMDMPRRHAERVDRLIEDAS